MGLGERKLWRRGPGRPVATRRWWPAAIAAGVAVLSPMTAEARRIGDPTIPRSHQLREGPLFAGRLAAWTEADGRRYLVRIGRRGRRARTVYRAPEPYDVEGLSASAWGLAFTQVPRLSGDQPTTVLAGPHRGPFTARGGCATPGSDLDRTRLFTLDQPFLCSPLAPARSSAVIEDLATGGRQVVPLGVHATGPLKIAGNYVAFRDAGPDAPITIFDWVQRRADYQIPRGLGFDLQADGKTAVSTSRPGRRTRIDWYAPWDPRPHRTYEGPSVRGIRLARNRIVFVRRPGRSRATQEIVYTRLSGSGLRVLARFGRPARRGRLRFLRSLADFNGSRIAWAERAERSNRVRIRIAGISRPTASPVPRRGGRR